MLIFDLRNIKLNSTSAVVFLIYFIQVLDVFKAEFGMFKIVLHDFVVLFFIAFYNF